MYECMCVCMNVCMNVCMYKCMYVCMYAWMHACMHACRYVCMYVCSSVYVCVCVNLWGFWNIISSPPSPATLSPDSLWEALPVASPVPGPAAPGCQWSQRPKSWVQGKIHRSFDLPKSYGEMRVTTWRYLLGWARIERMSIWKQIWWCINRPFLTALSPGF